MMHRLFSLLQGSAVKISSIFIVSAISFFTSCSHSQEGEIRKVQHEQISHAYSALAFREGVYKARTHQKGTFSCELDPDPLKRFQSSIIPYPIGSISFKVHDMPAGEYFLYCPSIGSPRTREVFMMVEITDSGSVRAQTFFPHKDKDRLISVPIHVLIYAIPGFSSDWYLISNENHGVYHSSFNYQPIISYGSKGQSIEIVKKECGGNLLEIVLRGFKAREAVTVTGVSEGIQLPFTSPKFDKNGEARFHLMPKTIGKKRGKAIFTVRTQGETIRAETEWDSATLHIKPNNPNTIMKGLKSSLSR